MARGGSSFRAPFLKSLRLRDDVERGKFYPWTVPLFKDGFELTFTQPVTIIMGPNGSGKSTLIEAIAGLCGFAQKGGSRNHALSREESDHDLARALRPSWLPKMTEGFFIRAETLLQFIKDLDDLPKGQGRDGRESGHTQIYAPYGGKSLHVNSHGEAFLRLFGQLRRRGIFIMDEPEAALSPTRQIELLRLIHDRADSGAAQFIIATHAPLLMACPGATLLEIEGDTLVERNFKATEHFRLMQDFYRDPDIFIDRVLS